MRKIAIILIAVLAVALPVAAQQQQPTQQPSQQSSQQSSQQQSQPILIGEDMFTQGLDLIDAQNFDQAVLDFSLVILLNPTFSPAYYGRAEGYQGLNDLDHALTDVNSAIDQKEGMQPDYVASLYSLRARIEQQRQQVDDAISDYTQSITLSPTVEGLASRALLYLSKSDYQSALADFDGAINLDTSNPVLYVYRGLVNTALDDRPAAGADYLQFFNLTETSTINSDVLNSGQSLSIQVDRGVVHRIPFMAKAGQFMSALAAASSASIDPLMVLVDSQGDALTGDDDSGRNGSALIIDYQIPADGEYTLVVGHSLGGFTGDVVISLQISDTALR